MINWNSAPTWRIFTDGDAWLVKIRDTLLPTEEVLLAKDANVQLYSIVISGKGKLVGYKFIAKTRKKLPKIFENTHALTLAYTLPEPTDRKFAMVFYDDNIRLIAFGKRPIAKDYFLALHVNTRSLNEENE